MMHHDDLDAISVRDINRAIASAKRSLVQSAKEREPSTQVDLISMALASLSDALWVLENHGDPQ